MNIYKYACQGPTWNGIIIVISDKEESALILARGELKRRFPNFDFKVFERSVEIITMDSEKVIYHETGDY